MAGSHVDVIEMDAASATGIDDIEIIENVRYRPSAARYKVFIIDEVHMLSTQAFNGLLKTWKSHLLMSNLFLRLPKSEKSRSLFCLAVSVLTCDV